MATKYSLVDIKQTKAILIFTLDIWMDGWMSGWMNNWMDGTGRGGVLTDELTDLMDPCMHKWKPFFVRKQDILFTLSITCFVFPFNQNVPLTSIVRLCATNRPTYMQIDNTRHKSFIAYDIMPTLRHPMIHVSLIHTPHKPLPVWYRLTGATLTHKIVTSYRNWISMNGPSYE